MDDARLQRLGQRIQQLRQDLGWTQGQLAETTQADRSQVSRLEAGERLVSAPVLARIAAALGTTVDDLLTDAGFIPRSAHSPQEPALAHLLRVLESYPRLRTVVAAWPQMSAEQRDRLCDLWLFEQARARLRPAADRSDPPTLAAMEQALREVAAESGLSANMNGDPRPLPTIRKPPSAAGAA